MSWGGAIRAPTLRSASRLVLVTLAFLSAPASWGCRDNPFGRPATVVDGSSFPPALQGQIGPVPAYAGGESVSYLPLAAGTPDVGEVTVLVGEDGEPLADCEARRTDENGTPVSTDLTRCQGPLFTALPGSDQSAYTPFLRVRQAVVPADYEPNAIRSAEEVAADGLEVAESDLVVDHAIVDPSASISDPTGALRVSIGWMDTLELVYLDLGADVPMEGGRVQPMDLLVPEGFEVGDGADVLSARPGEDGFSPLCRIVRFEVGEEFEPGDVRSADEIPESSRFEDPDDGMIHCGVP